MALADIRHEIVLSLGHTHEHQHDALDLLAHGDDAEKVVAAGELDFLNRQEVKLRGRLADVDRQIAEHHRTLFAWARQTWFSLMLYFESWIAHG
ncbi:MAG TPA: hypothetical protein VME40_10595 [Caulobacteraceae bacterium]|nr:hypothetical protein [Caulobacteraceae bacterium]